MTDGRHIGPQYPLVSATVKHPTIRGGNDWSLPAWARPARDSGFFSEDASAGNKVFTHGIDLSWRQVAPTPHGPLNLDRTGRAQGMSFESLRDQLAEPGPYWLRMFSTGVDWAPRWVMRKCDVGPIGHDYDGEEHLPIWNACVWSALRHTWRQLLVGRGILDDPDFRFAYVPGGFTWSEFDFDVISQAYRHGYVTKKRFLTWFDRMVKDFGNIGGDSVGRLVYTGEDYPWGPFGKAENLLATQAVKAGLGVRTGITELSNFHLSETPAYGSHITPSGHMAMRHRPPTGSAGRVTATENECYDDCGYHAKHLDYAVIMSNLKALQLRVNWLYVVPGPSQFNRLPRHWDWVRLQIGHTPANSPDAWVALRTATDEYWRWTKGPFGHDGRTWRHRPWVHNYERWLVQRNVAPHAIAHRSNADVHKHELESDNGIAYEGVTTRLKRGDNALAFDLDDGFFAKGKRGDVLVKVTYLDRGNGRWWLRVPGHRTAVVHVGSSGQWKTATVRVNKFHPDDGLRGSTDLWLKAAGHDVTVKFVRVVRLSTP